MAPEHKRLFRYGTMVLADIKGLPVAQAAEDTSHLYMGVPNALLPKGLAVMSGASTTNRTSSGRRFVGLYLLRVVVLNSCSRSDYTAARVRVQSAWNSRSLASSAQTILAFLLASATAATSGLRRSSSLCSQLLLSAFCWARKITDLAP